MPGSKVPPAGASGKAGLASVVALTSSLIVGAFFVLLPACYLLIPKVPLPEPLPSHHQTAETVLYILVFLVFLPAAVALTPRLADRLAAAHSGTTFAFLTTLVAGGMAAVVVLAKAFDLFASGQDLPVLLGLGLVWSASTAAALAVRPITDRLARLGAKERTRNLAVGTAAALFAAALLSFVGLENVDPPVLVFCLALGALAVYVWGRFRLPDLSGWKGRLLDLVVLLLVLAAVPDIPIYRVGDFPGDGFDLFAANTMQFHAALFLGASNAVLHGDYLLVDTVSQYGVGSIYLIAAWFELVPIDYGTLSLLDGMLAGVVFAMGYGILRMSGVARSIAIGAVLVTLIVLVYGLVFPIGAILQNGSIRFGLLPISLVALRLSALRWPGASRALGFLGWVVVGVSSIWALEGIAYVTATLAGMVAVTTVLVASGERRSWLLGQVGRTLIAWLTAHLALAMVTLAGTGELPDWGLYLTYLREFLSGSVGDLTYDYAPWSPAILVGFGYLFSALLLPIVAWRKPDWLAANRLAMIAAGGLTAYGIVQYSYFANRSLGMILPFVCFPLVLLGAIWLDRLLNHTPGVPGFARRGALGATLAVVSIAVSVAWPTARDRAPDSALAYGLPGGESLRAGLDRLGDMPPLVEGADEGERLLRKYMPGEDSSAVVVRYDEDVNILVRAERSNSLGITDSKENGWVPGPHLPAVRSAVSELEPGDRVLMDEGAVEAFYRIRRNPALADEAILFDYRLSLIQSQALLEIGKRFDLKTVVRGSDELVVVELVPRVGV